MAERPRKVLICSCEDTMPLDGDGVARGLPRRRGRRRRAICAAPSSSASAPASPAAGRSPSPARRKRRCSPRSPARPKARRASTFVNIRETAGWSKDADAAGPKMAALIAAAAEPMPEVAFVSLDSEGVTLIYGTRRARDRSRASC